jgi:arylsulfatase A-like enzyme
LRKQDPTSAELPKPLGYATGRFAKNHLGDRNEFVPTVHDFDEFYGNPEKEPELPDCSRQKDFHGRRQRASPSSKFWTG